MGAGCYINQMDATTLSQLILRTKKNSGHPPSLHQGFFIITMVGLSRDSFVVNGQHMKTLSHYCYINKTTTTENKQLEVTNYNNKVFHEQCMLETNTINMLKVCKSHSHSRSQNEKCYPFKWEEITVSLSCSNLVATIVSDQER